MADISSLVKALKDKAVAQYDKGAPYRQALVSALKGDTQGINQALSKSDLTPMDFALMMGINGVGSNSPYFKESIKEGYGKVIESPYGKISILSNNPHSPKTHSVTDFFVDESQRNKGYGQELLDEALRQYPTNIGAQVSSSPSAKAFYNKGFRLNSNPNANLNDILDEINNYSSAYMVK